MALPVKTSADYVVKQTIAQFYVLSRNNTHILESCATVAKNTIIFALKGKYCNLFTGNVMRFYAKVACYDVKKGYVAKGCDISRYFLSTRRVMRRNVCIYCQKYCAIKRKCQFSH